MNKLLRIMMVSLVIIIFLIRVVPLLKKNVRCDAYDEFLQMSFNGVVYEKFIDYEQHSYKTVIFRNFEKPTSAKILLDLDLSELYNNINVTDTIYKEVNNDSVFKIRNMQKFLISKVDFGCNR